MLFEKNKTGRKALSIILVASMLSTLTATSVISTMAVSNEIQNVAETAENTDSTENTKTTDYGLKENVQDGVILHAWNWSFDNIRERLPEIAESGYSAVQTSVAQKCKESTLGKTNAVWWLYYQPATFELEDRENYSALGTKADLQALCDEAEKYGIKVIVDVVANHLGNDGDCTKANAIPEEIRENDDFWHSDWDQYKSDSGRYGETQQNVGGLPDLNTSNKKIQEYVLKYLHECIDTGVDGFRFDTTKHIETNSESEPTGASSDFWETILVNGIKSSDDTEYELENIKGVNDYYAEKNPNSKPYIYGEILGDLKGGVPNTEYTQYMSITDDVLGNNIRSAVANGSVSGTKITSYYKGEQPQKYVLWAESHDTYSNDETTGSSIVSDSDINKTWALVASRNNATALYYARSDGYCGGYIGQVYSTECFSKEVAEVNKFHNYFAGESDYLATSGTISYNVRGTSGAVLVNVSGNETQISVPAKTMADGTYTDQISGNTFTVSGGQISGEIGDTGIAVIYNPSQTPEISVTPGAEGNTYQYSTDSIEVTLNASKYERAEYTLDDGTPVAFTNGTTLTLGADKDYETTQTLTVTATGKNGDTVSKTYAFYKTNSSLKIYFDKNVYCDWTNVYAYVYNDDGEITAWPGNKLSKTSSSSGYMYYELPEGYENALVIWSDGTNSSTKRYPADGVAGLEVNGESHLFTSGNTWEVYSETGPQVSATPSEESDTYRYRTETLAVTLNVQNAVEAEYSIDNSGFTDFSNGKEITIGQGTERETTQTLTLKAKDSDGRIVTKEYKFFKTKEKIYAYFDNSSRNWSKVCAYVYNTDGENNAKWPGVQVTTTTENGYYCYEIPTGFESGNVIWVDKNNTSNRYPADGAGGLAVSGISHLFLSDNSWIEYDLEKIASEPSISANPGNESGTYRYTTDTLTVTLNCKNVTEAEYSIDSAEAQACTDGQTITLGSGKNFETTQTLTLTAKDSSGNEITKTYTFYKSNQAVTVYFDNSSYNWTNVCAYVYVDGSSPLVCNGEWPGVKMTQVTGSENLYSYEITDEYLNKDTKVIFNNGIVNDSTTGVTGGKQYPSANGLDIDSRSKILTSANVWRDYNNISSSESYYRGDVNSDDKVDLKDCTIIQGVVLNKRTLDTTAQKLAGDVNGDGKIKISDMIIIMRYLIGFENSYNVGELVQGSESATSPTQATTATATETSTQATTPTATEAPTQATTPTATEVPTEDRVVYLNTTATPASGVKYCVYVWVGDTNQFIDMTQVGTELYSCTIPSKYTNVIFIKMPSSASTTENVWDNLYNQTNDLTLSDSYNLFTTTGYDTSTKLNGHSALVGKWSTYTP